MKGKDLRSQFDQLSAFKAADDVRRGTLPANPDAYKVELPEDFKLPQGVNFKFNEGDPLLGQARSVMHDIDTGKISGQEAFSKLLGLYAGAQVGGEAQIKAAVDAETAKLGPAATARMDAIRRWTNATVGETHAKALDEMMVTTRQVEALEELVRKSIAGGAGGFRQNGRDNEIAPKVTQEQYDRMTYGEKQEYARKHSGGVQQVNGHGR